ncbi:MAG TPA: META domain-containing protein [Pyrinomonadaceae bacterium]|nr:META domain-containing protein [Pyrinomonadaceae bacterium]
MNVCLLTGMLLVALNFATLSVCDVIHCAKIELLGRADHLADADFTHATNQNKAKYDLAGTSWQLVKFQGSDDSTLTPDDKSKYTIMFGIDRRVRVRLDCNRGRGTWKSTRPNQLRFGPLALTRAMCATGSLHDQIAKNWKFVRSYVIKEGHLFLSLMADGGIYEFEPMERSDESESLFGKRWRLTEVTGIPVKKSKPYIEFDRDAKRFSGDGGCNRIAGSFEITGMNIKFSHGISTRLACIDNEIQKLETEFLKGLDAVTRFEIQGNTLRLYAGVQPLLTFSSDSTETIGSKHLARVTGTITYKEQLALTPDELLK